MGNSDGALEQEIRRLELVIARPNLLAPASPTTMSQVEAFLAEVDTCAPPLTQQDVAGLLVLRTWYETLPAGVLNRQSSKLALLGAFAFAIKAEPHRMEAASFVVPADEFPPHALCEKFPDFALDVACAAARSAFQRYLTWLAPLSPWRKHPRDEREQMVLGIARLRCGWEELTKEAAELRAAAIATRREKRHTGKQVEDDDILGAIYELGPGEIRDSKIMRIDEDGAMKFDPKAMRSIYRSKQREARRREALIEELEIAESAEEEQESEGLIKALTEGHSIARDEVDLYILENWGDSNADIGRARGMTGEAIAARRDKLIERARRKLKPDE